MGGVTRCPASLQRLDALKRPMDVEQLALQRLMQTLNLPRIVGEWILVSRWVMPVWNRPVNTLPLGPRGGDE